MRYAALELSDDPQRSPREALLEAVLEHVEAAGTHELTMRGVAAAIGSSHRMLNYHFGSREGLLLAITREVERRQRQVLEELAASGEVPPFEIMEAMHQRFADPSLGPQERLFFDVYARALNGHADAEPLLEGVIDDWLDPVAELFVRLGFEPERAAAEARLAIAVARGLLLDLLATGDRAAVERASRCYLDRYRPAPG